MRINNYAIAIAATLMLTLTACGSSDTLAQATRVATQTPFIIYVPVTTTPEPATPTALPTVTPEATSRPTRTLTKTASAKPTATKAPPTQPPVASGPSPTTAPACTASAVTLLFPENGAPRGTRQDGTGGSALDFKWTPFQPGESESQIGYRVDLESKRYATNQRVNGDVIYISHNGFLRLGQHYNYDPRATSQLAGGDDATVTWGVTVVKTTGSFDDQGHVTGSVFNCSPPSARWTIQLQANS